VGQGGLPLEELHCRATVVRRSGHTARADERALNRWSKEVCQRLTYGPSRCNNVLWISAAKDGVKEEDTEMR